MSYSPLEIAKTPTEDVAKYLYEPVTLCIIIFLDDLTRLHLGCSKYVLLYQL